MTFSNKMHLVKTYSIHSINNGKINYFLSSIKKYNILSDILSLFRIGFCILLFIIKFKFNTSIVTISHSIPNIQHSGIYLPTFIN